MKQEFQAAVAALGGTTAYSGRTQSAVLTERTQLAHTVVHGRAPVNAKNKFSGYRKKIVPVGYYAGSRLIGFQGNASHTMYVKGLDEPKAIQLSEQFKDKKLPFQVVFQ